ncbi:MAG: AAA family ATPase [Deltaproteobacteria bacterium]|nr:AAA family ATPase [Deltaproteobacteria bacterium]
MIRTVDAKLMAWKVQGRRKPLIVRGARQVGKSFSISAFGRTQFEELVVVDLERDRRLHDIFEGDLSAKGLLQQLRLLFNARLQPGTSLLFLDEVQACPNAIRALRYFWEDCPELHVIAAGSLLDFALGEISFPVGRVQFLEMVPLSFGEFLLAQDQPMLAQQLEQPPMDLGSTIHETLLKHLRNYFFMGGMPEAVAAFSEEGGLTAGFEVQRNLAESYRQDFAKYAPRSDPRCLDAVFANVSQRVGEQIKYVRLAEGFSGPTIHKAFDLLLKARVLTKVPSSQPALPLAASASAKRFKALMVDIGLCQWLRGTRYNAPSSQADLSHLHRGAMAEQFVGQQLLQTQPAGLHYWARDVRGSSAEVDYLIEVGGQVIPVEVKSGSAGRLKSLHMLLEKTPTIPHALVFSTARYAELAHSRLRFVPLYYAGAMGVC